MRRAGSKVGGCRWRSARHHRRIGRNRPRGVAPSPSNLLARMPPRPSTTGSARGPASRMPRVGLPGRARTRIKEKRSEEHTSELQSLRHLVCRLLLEKKKKNKKKKIKYKQINSTKRHQPPKQHKQPHK